jgi:hypothetical protein
MNINLQSDGVSTRYTLPFTTSAITSVTVNGTTVSPTLVSGSILIFASAPPAGLMIVTTTAATGDDSTSTTAAYTSGQWALFNPAPSSGWTPTPFTTPIPDTWNIGFAFPNGFIPFCAVTTVDSSGIPHMLCTDGTTTVCHHWIADFATRTWVESDPLPAAIHPQYGVPNVTWMTNGRIIAVGYADPTFTPQAGTYLWTPTTSSASSGWQSVESYPIAAGYPITNTFENGQVIAMGGWESNGYSLTTVYSYDEVNGAAGTWTERSALPYAIEATSSCLMPSGNLFVPMGRSRTGGTATRFNNCLLVAQNGSSDFTYTQFTFPGTAMADVSPVPTNGGARMYGGTFQIAPLVSNQVWDFNEASLTFVQAASMPGGAVAAKPMVLPDYTLLFTPQSDLGIAGYNLVTTVVRGCPVPTFYVKQ